MPHRKVSVSGDRTPLTECEAFLLRSPRKAQGSQKASNACAGERVERLRQLNNYLDSDSGIMRVTGRRTSILTQLAKQRFWQIAMLTAAGSLGAGSSAEAALYYWPDYGQSYYRPTPHMQPRRAKVRRPAAK